MTRPKSVDELINLVGQEFVVDLYGPTPSDLWGIDFRGKDPKGPSVFASYKEGSDFTIGSTLDTQTYPYRPVKTAAALVKKILNV